MLTAPLFIPCQLIETTNNPPNPLYSSNAPRKAVSLDEATVDPREIDKVLSEFAGKGMLLDNVAQFVL